MLWASVAIDMHGHQHGPLTLTPRFLMALFRRLTTSMPSTPLTLKRLVQVNNTACNNRTPQVIKLRTNINHIDHSGVVHFYRSDHVGQMVLIDLLTSSSLVCAQGKENVNPTGSFLSLIFCFSMKSPRHSATWSNNCTDKNTNGLL